MRRFTVAVFTAAVGLAGASLAWTTPGSATRGPRDGAASSPMAPLPSGPSAAQALRTCVDRWNQASMVGWGPTFASVSIRRLDARERAELGFPAQAAPHCTVSAAVYGPPDPRTGCSGGMVMPGYTHACVYKQSTWVCVLNVKGAYDCPLRHEGDGPLKNENAAIDRHGRLTLSSPLKGTRTTPSLAWQRRYPHVDGYVLPWTHAGTLRHGLTLTGYGAAQQARGICIRGSELMFAKAALRCYSNGWFDPCFAPTWDWNRHGVVVACGGAGWTTFSRFVITRRS
jgi:hypothetical protein